MAITFRLPEQPVSESDPNKKKIITNNKGQAVGEEDPTKKQSIQYPKVTIVGGSSKGSSKSSSSQSSGPVFTGLPQSQAPPPQQSTSQVPQSSQTSRLVRNEPVFTGSQQSSFTSQASRQDTSQSASTPKPPRVSGTLRASTPEEIRAVRRDRNPFFQSLQGFRRGAELERGNEGLAKAVNPQTKFAETTGLIGGTLFTTVGIASGRAVAPRVASKVFNAAKATKAGGFVVQTAQKAKTGAQVTKAGEFTVNAAQKAKALINKNWGTRLFADIPITTAKGAAVVEGTKAVGKLTATSEQKSAMRSVEFDQAIRSGFAAESKAQDKWYKQLAFQINPALSTKKSVFKDTVTSELQSQGLSGRELQSGVDAALRQRKFISGGEAGGLLEISRSSERIGRREVANVFEAAGKKGVSIEKKKLGWDLFKKTFRPISQAGAVEGFSAEVTQQSSREEPLNIKKALGMSAAGAATAGIIGGGIAGLKPNRPGASKVLEIGTWFMDPFEKPGDVAADVTEFGLRKMGRKVPTPSIFTSSKPDSVVSFGVSGKPTSSGKASSTLPTLSTEGKSSGPIPTSRPIPFDSIWTRNPIPTPTTPTTPTKTKKPVNPPFPVFTPTVPPIATPTAVPIPIEEETPVMTPTNIFSPVTIPTSTPMFRMPPPIPLPFPSFGSGYGGNAGRGSSRFVNELDASLGVFGSMFSNPLAPGKTMSNYSVLKQPKANKAQAPSSISDALFGSPKKAKKSKRRK